MSDRFYFADKNYGLPYRFVYDTVDKSVEFTKVPELSNCELQLKEYWSESLFTKNNNLWYKLMTLYLKNVENSAIF